MICPICNKDFQPHRPNQVVCGAKNSTCRIKYRKLQVNGTLTEYQIRMNKRNWKPFDATLLSFISNHPATATDVPHLGEVREVSIPSTQRDLFSSLNK